MGNALSLPVEGVWISQVTSTEPHPLDRQMDGLRDRSEDAFRVVYEHLADDLVSFAYGMVSDRRTAEDIVQQAFVELVKGAPKIKGDGRALKAWMYRAVRFGCLDEYRRRTRRPERPVESLPEVVVADESIEHHLEPELEAALGQLTKRHRTAVLLRHVVGMSGEEIASVLKVSRRAAYSTLHRAEENLRQALGGPR